jgi:hypothetical protein
MKECKQCGMMFKPKRREQLFCSRNCASVEKGRMSSSWMKGRTNKYKAAKQIDKDGYIKICGTGHPYRENRLMISEHVAIMETYIGRRLAVNEVVHHINGNRQDNRIENLEIMSTSEHCRLHGCESARNKNRDEHGRFYAS